MLVILRRLTCTRNIKKVLRIQSLQKCSTLVESNVKKNIEKFVIFESIILNEINKYESSILQKYTNKKYANVILTHTKDGHYMSLKDLLLRTQIDLDIFNELCNLIVKDKMKKNSLVTPNINEKTVPNTIMGIHVGQTALCWSLLSYDFKVLDWDCITWQIEGLKSMKIYNVINIASGFVSQLPPTDTYVMEDMNIFKRFYDFHKLHFSIASCLKLIMDQRPNNSTEMNNDVYILNPLTTASFFRLLLNKEVLSTKYVMDVALNDIKFKNESLCQVQIDDTLKSKYIRLNDMQKEQINWSFLKAITFAYIIRNITSTV